MTNATVTDTLPAALRAATWTCVASAGSSCGQASGTGNINTTVSLLPGDAATFTLVATIAPTALGTLPNSANVTLPPDVIDPVTTNNSATDTDQLVPRVDLGITKTVTPAVVLPGDVVRYTLVVSNAGISAATGATVTDVLPASLTNAQWTCVATTGSSCGQASGSGNLATKVNLLQGGAATFTIIANVADSATTGNIVNVAQVTPAAGSLDPNPTNNRAEATNRVAAVVNSGPGTSLPPSAVGSDQKPGSILIFPLYTSNAAAPETQNTRINLTNIDP